MVVATCFDIEAPCTILTLVPTLAPTPPSLTQLEVRPLGLGDNAVMEWTLVRQC